MSGRSWTWAVILTAALGAGPAEAARLFPPDPPTLSGSSPAATEAYGIAIDATLLAAGPGRLELPIPGRGEIAIRAERIERRGGSDLAWRGRIEGGSGLAVLTLRRLLVAGLVYVADEVWEIAPIAGGGHRLERLDQELFPPCGDALPVDGDRPSDPARSLPVVSGPALATVDVLITYTPQARDAAGGTAAIEAIAQAAVDISNTAFAESLVDVRFRLAHAALSTRNDSGNYSADLAWLRNDPTTAALRGQYGADVVSLLVENAGGVCGVGYLGPGPTSVYQVTARSCAVGNLTWAHEHGHNLGMQHDPANGNSPGGSYRPWAFGHWVSTSPSPPGGNFRTVMSYSAECPFGCTRVPRFSNPDILYNGEPTGLDDGVCDPGTYNPGDPNAWGCRDNHRTANESGPIVATYEDPPSIFSDGFESGTTGAWSVTVP